MKLQDIIKNVQDYYPNPDIDLIRKAYSFVQEHHHGQTRASGEPYISHVTEVAYLATKLKLDVPSILTALLHDTVEDTKATLDEIAGQFGKDVADLVDGVTKLSQVNFSSRAEQQAENFRKMLLAMAQDIRILLVKLCDRLHNMRTLEFLSEARRQRIALETLEIYAPLAHRLGIQWIKSELEDLSFRFLKPEIYLRIKEQVSAKKREREVYIEEVVQLISRELSQNDVTAEVLGRPKHFYSIYQKMEKYGLRFDEIYDLIAFRIVVDSTMHCYSALGIIHAAWRPIPGRFKDYIAMPKPNKYQSLHTTVIGPKGARIEIQIRSRDMHETAEKGIAAHWMYKEGAKKKKSSQKIEEQFAWLRDMIESEKIHSDPFQFMSSVKEDLFPQEVFIFTPKGDLVPLPSNSTPIDFAYSIHSEIGDHCSGARVNGQQVPLDYRLRNGDTIEVTTSPHQVPSKDWLNIVASPKAKQRVRAWIRGQEQSRSLSIGKELLAKDMRKVKLNLNKVLKNGSLKAIAEELKCRDVDTMISEIGYGKVSTNQVVKRLLPDETNVDERLAQAESAIQKIFQRAAKAFRETSAVKVNGLDDVVFRFAKCCEPLPGDPIVGYVTRGRGVAVHTRGCSQTLSFDQRRLISVSWDKNITTTRRVSIRVISVDRVGILAAMTQAISACGANIYAVHATTTPDGKGLNTFEVNVESIAKLDEITRALERIDGVIRVERNRKVRGAEEEPEEPQYLD